MTSDVFTAHFDSIDLDDVPRVGGKNASLGEMYQRLVPRGVRVPPGFATTAEAYRQFLEANDLNRHIEETLADLEAGDVTDLRQRGSEIRETILASEFPEPVAEAIVEAYRQLRDERGPELDVAVRSSATAEDLPDASFAGQQETFLNIRGEDELLEACRKCFASLFTDRAISYRAERDFSADEIALSVGVQEMVRADVGTAGVAFSIDTETGFDNAVLINASWGLGEAVVKGAVNPDEYYVFKPTLREGHRPIISKNLGAKKTKTILSNGEGETTTRTVDVPEEDRDRYALDDDDILQLAEWVCDIEDHYSDRHDRPMPMDIEWALDGETGELFILQARPETVQSQRRRDVLRQYKLVEEGDSLVEGRSVGDLIDAGDVQVTKSVDESIETFEDGNVLVTETTDPDWEPIMKRASAIVTDRGGRTSHAAIVSRELGVPAIVGANDATKRLEDGQSVTVSCAEGEIGYVYDGELEYDVHEVELTGLERPDTEIMMNIADPSRAFRQSMIPNDGVGLAREEFIVNNYIGIHPMALLEPERLDDETRRELEERTRGCDDKAQYFVDRLAQGVATIGAAFYPEDVIVRMSDFKSNEYASLLGGEVFEPDEENPMIGFRGASRYYHDEYREAFKLECQAIKRVRDEMGLTNIKTMIPFCRTPEEGKRVQEVMAEEGLERGRNDLEIYVMAEIPSNIVLAEEFAEIFDGFSIGSNDLTQFTLGVDRDSDKLVHLFDERHEAVKEMIRMVIDRAHACNCKVGICGQAPSDYPEFAEFLVEAGIDSISLTPDSVLKTTLNLAEDE